MTWSPPQKAPSGQPYRLIGYINEQNMVERVETWVEHPVLGDLHVDTTYSDYQDFGGLKVPVEDRAETRRPDDVRGHDYGSDANPPNLTELLTPPAAAAGRSRRRGAAAARLAGRPPRRRASEKLADGVYRITGGYVALAVEFKDHVVVLEGGQSEARGLAVIAETKKLIPEQADQVRRQHAPALRSRQRPGAVRRPRAPRSSPTTTTRLSRAGAGAPRTLVGDMLAKANKKPKVEGVGDKRVLKDETRTIELHHIQNLEHSDGMLVAFLPKEKILFTADFNSRRRGSRSRRRSPRWSRTSSG